MSRNPRPDTTRKNKHLVNTTFHITNHGIDDLQVLGDHRDKREFIACLQRHLTRERLLDAKRRPYKKWIDQAVLLAYCVMDNHFHLILHQQVAGGMAGFMRSVQAGYGAHFNRRHDRRGALFMHKYSATPILDHEHAKRAVAYVHLNHEQELLDYQYTSHAYYLGLRNCDWIDSRRGLQIFGGPAGYERYLRLHGPSIVEAKQRRRDDQAR